MHSIIFLGPRHTGNATCR